MDVEMLYLNGTFMPLSEGRVHVEDRGFQLGDGVYEVIKVMNGRLVWLEDHLERLDRNLAEVRFSEAAWGHRLGTILPELVVRSGVDHGSVYVQVTRGYAPREFVFPQPPHPTVLAYARSRPGPSVEEILAGTALHPSKTCAGRGAISSPPTCWLPCWPRRRRAAPGLMKRSLWGRMGWSVKEGRRTSSPSWMESYGPILSTTASWAGSPGSTCSRWRAKRDTRWTSGPSPLTRSSMRQVPVRFSQLRPQGM